MHLLASDLDNTMIYSYKKELPQRVLVEQKDGKALSYMTAYAYARLQQLPQEIRFTPITTRSLEQYQRIQLPGAVPTYALTDNGGILLRKGKIDRQWLAASRKMAEAVGSAMEKAADIMQQDGNRTLEVCMVDGLFLFTKSSLVAQTVQRLQQALDLTQVDVQTNGQKVYVFPKALNKGAMLKRLQEEVGASYTVACGDSLFDIPMLMQADLAIFPEALYQGALKAHKHKHMIAEEHLLSDEVFKYLDTLSWQKPCQ